MQLDNGTYRARAVEAVLGTAKTGTEQVAVRFALLDRPGEHVTWRGFFTPAAVAITIKALRTAGFVGADLADLSSLARADTPEVLLVVENEEYDGRWAPKVKWVNPTGGLSMKGAMTGEEAARFSARMRGEFAAFDAKVGGAKSVSPASRGPAAAAQEPDVDLPF